MSKKNYKYYGQLDVMDCGPTCIKMVSAYYGKNISIDYLREKSFMCKTGVNLTNLSLLAEEIGFKTLMVSIEYEKLVEQAPLPCILHWNKQHYVVLYDVKEKKKFLSKNTKEYLAVIADPAHGIITLDKETFLRSWSQEEKSNAGVALLLEPKDIFNSKKTTISSNFKSNLNFLIDYTKPYKKYIFQIFVGMLLGSAINLALPFLTQFLVDFGIENKNLNLIHLVLVAQLALFIGNISIDIIRNWIVLHVNIRISVSIISNFLIKLTKLPISYFDSKNIGDIAQRINDHHKIESFLTNSTINTFFSILNIFIFSIVLSVYDVLILTVFLLGSFLSFSWVFLFLKKRKDLDYKRFQRLRENQSNIYELITGMQEIKLNNCEDSRRHQWEKVQAKLFQVNMKSLNLEQYQEVGSSFFNQLKNILITYLAATKVISGEISLGSMLSISYIIGQMNGPLNHIIEFVKNWQDAKMSLDRLSEVHNKQDEGNNDSIPAISNESVYNDDLSKNVINLNNDKGIYLKNISFKYGSEYSPWILRNVTVHIPKSKVTAIVGSSGSGKTTLLKMLLKFYDPQEGIITVDGKKLIDINSTYWRRKCGTVMQDSFIFSDTIEKNISISSVEVHEERLINAIHVSNIGNYIEKLPMGLSTKIGSSGAGMSGGQRQRVTIARAVYKDPEYIFFDEATSSLDASNEMIIMNNLKEFFSGKTVVVIAHRLSTVRDADQIIVLDNGEIKEVGTHNQLIVNRGYYFKLVQNQLEVS